jgi:predicted ATP-dependent protease
LFPAVNLKDIGDVPADVRDKLELVPVDTMDEVFSIALHRVILPTKIAGQFIIEVDDDDEDDDNDSSSDAEQIAKGGR